MSHQVFISRFLGILLTILDIIVQEEEFPQALKLPDKAESQTKSVFMCF